MAEAKDDLVFTPRTRDGERQEWKQSDIRGRTELDIRGYGYKYDAVVDGKEYRIYGASCSIGTCCCDAVALDITEDDDLIKAIDELVELGMMPKVCGD